MDLWQINSRETPCILACRRLPFVQDTFKMGEFRRLLISILLQWLSTMADDKHISKRSSGLVRCQITVAKVVTRRYLVPQDSRKMEHVGEWSSQPKPSFQVKRSRSPDVMKFRHEMCHDSWTNCHSLQTWWRWCLYTGNITHRQPISLKGQRSRSGDENCCLSVYDIGTYMYSSRMKTRRKIKLGTPIPNKILNSECHYYCLCRYYLKCWRKMNIEKSISLTSRSRGFTTFSNETSYNWQTNTTFWPKAALASHSGVMRWDLARAL